MVPFLLANSSVRFSCSIRDYKVSAYIAFADQDISKFHHKPRMQLVNGFS